MLTAYAFVWHRWPALMYGLAVVGQEVVETVIESILADFDITLGLCGYKTPADILGEAEKLLVDIGCGPVSRVRGQRSEPLFQWDLVGYSVRSRNMNHPLRLGGDDIIN